MSQSHNATSGGGMLPYLHFTGGDTLVFAGWTPTSAREIVGASFALFGLALFDRWFAAMRGVVQLRWRRQASKQPLRSENNATSSVKNDNTTSSVKDSDAATSVKDNDAKNDNTISSIKDDDAASFVKTDKEESVGVAIEDIAKSSEDIPAEPSQRRTFPPFILAHDGPRGLLYGVQAFLGYLLMLSVMTFQVAYLLSILAGLGVGEVLFGRAHYAEAH